jgi:NAD(P)-dependent dehydrogenase (short-subunit alcohol dehydrogenase family)
MSTTPPNALIIGASRGLGLALAEEYRKRGWSVVATVRGAARTGLHEFAARSGGGLEIETVDIVEPDQVATLRRRLEGRTFDLLFVNAGILTNTGQTICQVPTEDFTHLMVTNALNPMRVVEAFESLVTPTGTIGVMSSGLGSIARNTHGSWDAYSASKRP